MLLFYVCAGLLLSLFLHFLIYFINYYDCEVGR